MYDTNVPHGSSIRRLVVAGRPIVGCSTTGKGVLCRKVALHCPIYIYICKLGCVFSSGDPESLDLGLISLHLPWGLTTRGRIDLLSPSIDLLSPEWFATEEVARRLRAPRRLEVRQRGSAIGVWLSVGRRLTAYHLACS